MKEDYISWGEKLDFEGRRQVQFLTDSEWNAFCRLVKDSGCGEPFSIVDVGAEIITVKYEQSVESEFVHNSVTQLALNAMRRVIKWHKKKDMCYATGMVFSYGSAIWFFSALYKQTHGIVAVIVMIIAFALLFIPWWIMHLKSFFESFAGDP
jgi:hypothetical protein